MTTVREFVRQSYRLINASNPTTPLYGDDEQLAITVLNQLLQSYASTGLLITIARTASVNIGIDQQIVTVGSSTVMPTPDIPIGRLANLDSAWLLLDGVTYPLILISRDEFLASFKYDPLHGLPRFVITFPGVDVVELRIYPSPSQVYLFNIRGKFQLDTVTSNSTLDALTAYYMRYLLLAVAKDMAMYKGRADAWTQLLESQLTAARDQMEAATEVNLSITGDRASLLNGAWRVRAGI